MYKVCAYYCGAEIMLAEFDNEDDAEIFCTLPFAVEETDPSDEWIYPYQMWIEKAKVS
jgi:hypothetical protein